MSKDSGHMQSGNRGNKKIGFSGSGKKASDNQESTSGGKSPKRTVEFDCGCAEIKGQPNS